MNSLNFQYLSQEVYEKILEIVDSLHNNQFTQSFFSTDRGECLTQLEIFWDYHGVNLKSKLDIVLVNKEDKTIQPIDVKTTDNPRKFKDIFERFRYNFQAAAYTLALKEWIIQNKEYEGFKILPFTFIVEGVKYTGSPLIYEISEETMNKSFTEFDIACEKYLFHTSNNLWDYSMEDYHNYGTVKL
jgi:hypothetical protein